MLPREHRLQSGDSFREAVRRGRRSGGRLLVLHLWTTQEAESPARVGFVVSKTVGNAVTRNRVKRRLRHLARERIHSLPGSAVLVVRALPASAEASYDALGAELDRALGRVTS
ncbi:MAG TPA: ribonuclease P protein component [Intrasporangium sp.]|nr:ribonuclease P protein component [Intrasporangium sp.]